MPQVAKSHTDFTDIFCATGRSASNDNHQLTAADNRSTTSASTFQVGYLDRRIIKNTDYHKYDTDKHIIVEIRA